MCVYIYIYIYIYIHTYIVHVYFQEVRVLCKHLKFECKPWPELWKDLSLG